MLAHEHRGVFAGVLPVAAVPDYRLEVRYGPVARRCRDDDPYRWLPTLGEIDLHLIGEGRHENRWDGPRRARPHLRHAAAGQVTGTSFAVWAPNARGVRVIGDFNHWYGAGTPMRSLGSTGVWELFVPGLGDGHPVQVPDPRAGRRVAGEGRPDGLRAPRCPPATASVVFTLGYEWADDDWMAGRGADRPARGPMSDLRGAPRLVADRACPTGSWPTS